MPWNRRFIEETSWRQVKQVFWCIAFCKIIKFGKFSRKKKKKNRQQIALNQFLADSGYQKLDLDSVSPRFCHYSTESSNGSNIFVESRAYPGGIKKKQMSDFKENYFCCCQILVSKSFNLNTPPEAPKCGLLPINRKNSTASFGFLD